MSQPKKKVEMSALVDREAYIAFTTAVPVFGANRWFINNALALFLEEVAKRPGIVDPLQVAVMRMVEETLGYEPDVREREPDGTSFKQR